MAAQRAAAGALRLVGGGSARLRAAARCCACCCGRPSGARCRPRCARATGWPWRAGSARSAEDDDYDDQLRRRGIAGELALERVTTVRRPPRRSGRGARPRARPRRAGGLRRHGAARGGAAARDGARRGRGHRPGGARGLPCVGPGPPAGGERAERDAARRARAARARCLPARARARAAGGARRADRALRPARRRRAVAPARGRDGRRGAGGGRRSRGPSSRSYALLLAAVATLAWNPRSAADPGWQLSFAAVAGILVLGAPLGRALGGGGPSELAPAVGGGGSSRALADGVAITRRRHGRHGAAARAPFRLGPAGGAAREPAGAAGGGPGDVARHGQGRARAAPGPRRPATRRRRWARPRGLAVRYLGALAERFADAPAGQLELGAPLAARGGGRLRGSARRRLGAGARRASARARRPRARRRAGAGCPRRRRAALLAAAAARRRCSPWRRRSAGPARPTALTVRFLDVGQGDATLIQHPDGTAVLFDGGPPEAGVTRLLRRAGVRRLDLGRGHPRLARPPRRAGRRAGALPGRRAARRRRRHRATPASGRWSARPPPAACAASRPSRRSVSSSRAATS